MKHSWPWFRILLTAAILLLLCPSSAAQSSISITNPGFETLPSNPGWITCAGTGCRDTLDGNIPGWTSSSNATIGLFQPSSTYFTVPLPAAEGTTIAQVNSGTLTQTLTATFQANTVYTLQVDIGRRLDNLYPSPAPTAQLYAGTVLIATATGSQPALGGWTTWTGTYNPANSNPFSANPTVGSALKIVLGTTASQGDFDNVKLTSTTSGGSSGSNSITVFGTGVQSVGVLAADSATDPHYQLTSSADPAYPGPALKVVIAADLPSTAPYAWLPDGPNSKWISPRNDAGNNSAGTYTYHTSFDLTGLDPTTAVLTGQFAADDSVVIKLNGAATGASAPQFQVFTPFTIKSGFIAGVNSLDFVVTNAPAAAAVANSTGLRVDISGTASPASSTSGTNLIVNPGAEASAATGWDIPATTIPGWTTDGNVAIVAYADPNGDLATTTPGPPNPGLNYFAAVAVGVANLNQSIDVSSSASSIDTGGQAYTLDGWLGGWDGQDDNSMVTATFQSSTGASLGSATIGPVTEGERGGVSELLEQTTTGKLPVGTRKVLITVTFTRVEGSDNDSPVDNLSFVLAGATVMCSYSLSATSASGFASTGTVTLSVTAGSGCTWTASTTASWITVASGASGTGNGTVSLQVAANTGAARTGTVTIAGQTFTVNQAAGSTSCSYNVNPTDVHATAAGLSGTFLIVTNTSCTWTASVPSGVGWVTLSPNSGTGSGASGYSIAANTGAARNTTLTVAGVSVTVEQDAASTTCSYAISPSSQTISGAGGAEAVSVTVSGSNCPAWTVSASPVSWLHVTSASSQTGSGMVAYSVDANPGSTQRATSLTIANQAYSITQQAPPCNYVTSASSSPNIPAAGGTGTIGMTVTGSVCSWVAALPTGTAAQWAHITSAANAGGSGTIAYSVDPNPTTNPRSLILTITGQKPVTVFTYVINQAAGTANTNPPPVITPGGLVNAASFISANIPAGSIAQGSFFSIFGTNLGPATAVSASSYPLSTNLGGVTIAVTQGSTTVAAIPVFVAPFQINAVMPSNTPTGTVQVTVSYGGLTSPPVQTQVVVTNFASFAVAGGRGPGIIQNYVSPTQLPLNTATTTAAPGDTVILWGTGLGPLPNGASDSQPPAGGSLPVAVQITVGTVNVQPVYSGRAPGLAGVDQINFVIPQNAPQGCYVPIQVVAAGMPSNAVSMAIAANRQPCSAANPISSFAQTGGKNATVVVSRLTFTDASNPATSGTMDLGLAAFEQQSANTTLGFDPYASAPPRNTCTYTNNVNSLNAILIGQMPSNTAGSNLDAGSTITITGPNGSRGLSYSDSSARTSPYFGLFGASGSVANSGLTADPLFLDPGSYTISGNGGKDVGPFSVPLTVASGATWTNRDQITTIDRTQGLLITWSGGNATNQVGMIIGMASNPTTNVSGAFGCVVTFDQHSFTVPASIMNNLPSTAGANPGDVQSGLLFLTFPAGTQFAQFTTSAAPNLSNGVAIPVVGDLRSNVIYK